MSCGLPFRRLHGNHRAACAAAEIVPHDEPDAILAGRHLQFIGVVDADAFDFRNVIRRKHPIDMLPETRGFLAAFSGATATTSKFTRPVGSSTVIDSGGMTSENSAARFPLRIPNDVNWPRN